MGTPDFVTQQLQKSKGLLKKIDKGPLGHSGTAQSRQPVSDVSVADTAKAPYKMATDQRKNSLPGPAGDTTGQELKQAEENANQTREAAKQP